ncbi:MAG: hypothetical protein K2W33_18525, partial [Burkholderiales bacterium]|nr:hypothetical protein [Burkholderiales bacterium]
MSGFAPVPWLILSGVPPSSLADVAGSLSMRCAFNGLLLLMALVSRVSADPVAWGMVVLPSP